MKPALPLFSLLVVALVGCSDRASVAVTDPVDDERRAADGAYEEVPPANAPQQDEQVLARFDGYGDMRFGMTAAEANAAWAGKLNGAPGADSTCYYLSPIGQPDQAYFAFMIEGDRFVRYDVGNDRELAPGGGRRGMDEADIERLYAGRVERQGHKYVEGGEYLRIADDAGGSGVLVFETDPENRVTEWRVGVPPQVDYVEGCS